MASLPGRSEILGDREAPSSVASASGSLEVIDEKLEHHKKVLNELPLIQQCDPNEAMLGKLAEGTSP